MKYSNPITKRALSLTTNSMTMIKENQRQMLLFYFILLLFYTIIWLYSTWQRMDLSVTKIDHWFSLKTPLAGFWVEGIRSSNKGLRSFDTLQGQVTLVKQFQRHERDEWSVTWSMIRKEDLRVLKVQPDTRQQSPENRLFLCLTSG